MATLGDWWNGLDFLTKSLNLIGCNLSDDKVQHLACQLRSNTIWTTIYLSANSLKYSGVNAIAEALRVNTTLVRLTMSMNGVRVYPKPSIADALKCNHTLKYLCLSRNHINDYGGTSLAEALSDNWTLTHLDLKCNRIGDKAAKAFAKALSDTNDTLLSLNLSGNCIGHEGGMSIAAALRVNSTLTSLSITYNSYGLGVNRAIESAIKEDNFTLEKLHYRCRYRYKYDPGESLHDIYCPMMHPKARRNRRNRLETLQQKCARIIKLHCIVTSSLPPIIIQRHLL
jgi:hypothetical protein